MRGHHHVLRVLLFAPLVGCAGAHAAGHANRAERTCEGAGDIESRAPHPVWRSCVRREGTFTGWYDEQGRQTRFEIDRDGDQSPDSVERLLYEHGHLVRSELDSNNDGEVDFITTWTYAPDGRRLRHEQDHGADGTLDVRLEYLYDPAGRPIGERSDTPPDGNVDLVYRYDTAGERVLTETHTYDEEGGSHTVRSDSNGDGELDRCEGPLCEPTGAGPFGLGP